MTVMARTIIDQVLAIVGKALVPRRPTERQAVWGIRITVALALLILSLVLGSRSGFLSSDNAAVMGALLALTGVLIAQVVNTNIARATQRHQQVLEYQRARSQRGGRRALGKQSLSFSTMAKSFTTLSSTRGPGRRGRRTRAKTTGRPTTRFSGGRSRTRTSSDGHAGATGSLPARCPTILTSTPTVPGATRRRS
jgi:hypothetical protein